MSESVDQREPDELSRRLVAAKMMLRAAEARQDLLAYAPFMTPDPSDPDNPLATAYSIQPHHRIMASAVRDVFEGRHLRVAVSIPPQHGKTQLLSKFGLAWFSGTHPYKHIIMGAYNQEYADEIGEDVRAIIQSPRHQLVFPRHELRKGSKAKDHMVTHLGGKLAFLGRGGSGTGRPADGILIDDPFKNALEAESAAIRDDAWNWFTTVMNTRAHTLTWMFIVMTRWHDDDIVGRLTNPKNKWYDEMVASQWKVINIPAIIDTEEASQLTGIEIGQPLWKQRFSLTHLETARRMNPDKFSALYMGRPTPPEGSFFKRQDIHGYKSMKEVPKALRKYGGMDLAVSPDRNADSTVALSSGLDEDDTLWIMPNIIWHKKSADESVEAILDMCDEEQWFEAFVEKGVIDRGVGPFLEKRAEERKIVLNMTKFPAVGSKGQRAMAIRGRMRQGKVRFPFFAPWWEAALDQLLKFTGSGDDAEDDFCDALAMIGQGIGDQIKASKPKEEPKIIRVGSWAWAKAQYKREQERANKRKQLAGR